MRRLPNLSVIVLLVSAFYASELFAGYGAKQSGGGANTNTNTNTPKAPPAAPPPPVDHSASIGARKQVTEATAQLTDANRALAEIVNKLRQAFQRKPEWIAAQSAMKADQAAMAVAHDAVLDKLQKDPAYSALKATKVKAEAERDALEKEPGASAEDKKRVGDAVFAATEATNKAENAALLADGNVAAARAQLATSNQKVTALLSEFDASLQQNPDWQAASQVVAQKQQVLADARKALATAIATEAQAERDRQKQMAQSH